MLEKITFMIIVVEKYDTWYNMENIRVLNKNLLIFLYVFF